MQLLNKLISKKNCAILFLLLACFIHKIDAQVRIVSVDPSTDVISFKNYGNTTIDITNWWVCARFVYTCIDVMTIENGNPILLPGETVTVSGFSLNNTSSDLGLFDSPAFSSTTAMQDFMQYGAGGIGRESVAVAKGIWDAGTFINGTVVPPYGYTGNGSTDNGVSFWDSFLSIPDNDFSTGISIYPIPNNGKFTIESQSVPFNYVQVYDIKGNLIFEERFNTSIMKMFDLNLSSGIYLLKLSDEHANLTIERIIIK